MWNNLSSESNFDRSEENQGEMTAFHQQWMNATDEDKNNLALALRGIVEVTKVLPPPRDQDVQVLIMAITYMMLFLLGTCGNVAVLTTIYHVVRSRRATVDNTLLYVIVLSCVDFGVCLSLPFTVIDQILGFWMFGLVVCKLHAVLENVGKILSALIITAMSFDRYAGVCHAQRRWMRSRSLAVGILFGLAAYALATLCPMLWSFRTREYTLYEKMTAPNKMTRMQAVKCSMGEIDSTMFTMFTIYQCVLCYCVPLFLVIFFYSRLLEHLREHSRQFKATRIPLMRITLFTMAVAGFYFLCWTPFWVATVFAVYLEHSDEQSDDVPPLFVYCMYFIHALPFTNSAINWILYGALNGQLQQRYRSHRGETLTTGTAVGNHCNGGNASRATEAPTTRASDRDNSLNSLLNTNPIVECKKDHDMGNDRLMLPENGTSKISRLNNDAAPWRDQVLAYSADVDEQQHGDGQQLVESRLKLLANEFSSYCGCDEKQWRNLYLHEATFL